MKNRKSNPTYSKAFTLVELIIALTILMILWIISFISIQWYTQRARDASRISDIQTIVKALEVQKIKSNNYPIPTDGIEVTYSWAEVWTQWVVWKSVVYAVDWLTKIRKDPLTNIPLYLL